MSKYKGKRFMNKYWKLFMKEPRVAPCYVIQIYYNIITMKRRHNSIKSIQLKYDHYYLKFLKTHSFEHPCHHNKFPIRSNKHKDEKPIGLL